MKARIRSCIAGAVVALAVAVVAFGAPTAASGNQGDPVIAGQGNNATGTTEIDNLNTDASTGVRIQKSGSSGSAVGLSVEAPGSGLESTGTTGVFGQSSGAGDGVDGKANNSCCSAVFGLNQGTGNGVAGQADQGTGVLAVSASGIALKVSGKVQLSRSGFATVAGTASNPKNSVKVTVPITSKSMMTATLQKYVAGVYVVAAMPNVSGGTFTIFLNKTVTMNVGPIAWQVVERP